MSDAEGAPLLGGNRQWHQWVHTQNKHGGRHPVGINATVNCEEPLVPSEARRRNSKSATHDAAVPQGRTDAASTLRRAPLANRRPRFAWSCRGGHPRGRCRCCPSVVRPCSGRTHARVYRRSTIADWSSPAAMQADSSFRVSLVRLIFGPTVRNWPSSWDVSLVANGMCACVDRVATHPAQQSLRVDAQLGGDGLDRRRLRRILVASRRDHPTPPARAARQGTPLNLGSILQ